MSQRYKQRIYYVITTKDRFLQNITNEIYDKTHILEVRSVSEDKTKLLIKGSQDYRLYETPVSYFNEKAQLQTVINIILN